MKFLTLVLLFTLFTGILADGYKRYYRNPKYPGKCVYHDVIVSPGQHGQPKGKCERFTCTRGLRGEIESCEDTEVEPPCVLGEFINPDDDFPDCCWKHVICPDNKNKKKN